MGAHYPDDDDGEALRRVEESGVDMLKPMKIEFSIDVPSEKRAHLLVEKIAALQSRHTRKA